MTASNVKEKPRTSTLVQNSYGKSIVRLTKINRESTPPTWKEITVDTELLGDEFAGCYYDGDNSKVVATDSMKNTVYVEGSKHSLSSIEEFGMALAKHYLDDYAHVKEVIVKIKEDMWCNIPVNGKVNPTSFFKSGGDNRVTTIHMDRTKTDIESGVENLVVAKIADSEFAGFIKDNYTTLKETHDRIFGTTINAHWTYNNPKADFNAVYEATRTTILETFADHHSLSVQQTLYAMGDAVLNAVKDIEQISMILPNIHRIPFDLKPFGLENRNEVFVTTSEPQGTIKGTVARKK
ncbi:MAG: urate oxidase [Candidatus Obscuribacterales bacterium]|nr:urate oxidase [Candidatus Obscuribacterales bacterium]